jgi:hypothetical protein
MRRARIPIAASAPILRSAMMTPLPLLTLPRTAVLCRLRVAHQNGSTPLHLAAEEGNASVVTLLLERGADMAAKTEVRHATHPRLHRMARPRSAHQFARGGSAQRHAARDAALPVSVHASSAVLSLPSVAPTLFASHGTLTPPCRRARFVGRMQCGNTPLHLAAQHGRTFVVMLLLERGADKEAKQVRRAAHPRLQAGGDASEKACCCDVRCLLRCCAAQRCTLLRRARGGAFLSLAPLPPQRAASRCICAPAPTFPSAPHDTLALPSTAGLCRMLCVLWARRAAARRCTWPHSTATRPSSRCCVSAERTRRRKTKCAAPTPHHKAAHMAHRSVRGGGGTLQHAVHEASARDVTHAVPSCVVAPAFPRRSQGALTRLPPLRCPWLICVRRAQRDNTPLHLAALGDTFVVRLLLDRGADKEAKNKVRQAARLHPRNRCALHRVAAARSLRC